MRKKIKFYKSLVVELIETLCSICLMLERIGHRNHYQEAYLMHDHFQTLKKYSEELRR